MKKKQPMHRPLPLLALLAAALLLLQACSSTPTGAPPAAGASRAGTPPGAAAPAPGAANPAVNTARDRSALETECQWLQAWFRDTPVQIVQASDTISLAVPREFAFDAARSQVKPPLAAVLDKVAQSLRRLPQARLELVAAPADAGAASVGSSGTGAGATAAQALAVQRAAMVRRHLISRGVPAAQIGTPSAATVAAVQLRLELPAP